MEAREEQSKNDSATLWPGPGSSSRTAYNDIFEFFSGNWGHHPGGGWQLQAEHKIPRAHSWDLSRKKAHTLQPSPETYKNFPSKTIRELRVFEHESPISLLGPVITHSLLQTLNVLSSLCIRSMDLGSVPMAWASNNFLPKVLFSSPSRNPYSP